MKNYLITGTLFLLIGIVLSAVFKEAHYYTFFSIGAFILLQITYNKISKYKLFNNWNKKQHVIFWSLMLLFSLTADNIAMYLGYWYYPSYSSLFDDIIKYAFEWVMPLAYIMLEFMIGIELFRKAKLSKFTAFILSLLIVATLMGIITEYFNHLAGYSWKVLSMPFTDYQINGYFVIFQTIGYWLMSLFPFLIYKTAEIYQVLSDRQKYRHQKPIEFSDIFVFFKNIAGITAEK